MVRGVQNRSSNNKCTIEIGNCTMGNQRERERERERESNAKHDSSVFRSIPFGIKMISFFNFDPLIARHQV